MIKIIQLEDKELKLSSAAAFLLVYKQQFKREPLKDIMEISENMEVVDEKNSTELIANLDLEVVYNLAWALAKTANYSKVNDPISFYIENENFKPIEHIDTIISMALTSISPDFELDIEKGSEEKN